MCVSNFQYSRSALWELQPRLCGCWGLFSEALCSSEGQNCPSNDSLQGTSLRLSALKLFSRLGVYTKVGQAGVCVCVKEWVRQQTHITPCPRCCPAVSECVAQTQGQRWQPERGEGSAVSARQRRRSVLWVRQDAIVRNVWSHPVVPHQMECSAQVHHQEKDVLFWVFLIVDQWCQRQWQGDF